MTALTIPSPAKLNLMLLITGRRDDGYHNLQTVFQLLDYGDTLHFEPRSDDQIILTPAIHGVANEDNLIVKAARLLQKHTKCTAGANISLEKIIPMGGGLGGGSSNAATTLLALNILWETQVSISTLSDLGLQLGADVPVFVQGHSAWAEGVGEQLQALEIPEKWYLVIKPGCEINTSEIFCHKRLTRDSHAIRIAPAFKHEGRNDCEAVVREIYPEVNSALNWLDQYSKARLTGTGSCVYGSFSDKNLAEQALSELPGTWQGFIAKGVNISPAYKALNKTG